MIESTDRADFGFEERIGETLVMVKTLRIGLAGAIGLNARPRDGETVAGQIQLLEERDVFFVAMVGIAGDVAGGCALHLAGSVHEAVPDGFALAVFCPSAFDLVGSGGGAPDKLVGKLERREFELRFEQFAEKAMAGRQDGK